MPKDSAGEAVPDADVEALREALAKLTSYLSAKDVLRLARRYAKLPGPAGLFGERALRNFVTDDASRQSKTIAKPSYEALKAVAFISPIGRAIRGLDPDRLTPFDQLTFELGGGAETVPEGLQVEGRYYLYHGSYLLPGHYVVRRLTITPGADGVLLVEDIVRDTKTATNAPRRAAGVMLFADKRPQILMHADENKQGLSLVGFHDIGSDRGELDRGHGALMVMNQRRELAFRPCLLVRVSTVPPETMIEETGIYTPAELRDPRRQRHARAFDQLKEQMAARPFADPMLDWKPEA